MNLLKIEGANCGNFGGCKNLATCKFRNLQNFAGCQFSQPANTAHACTCLLLFDPLVGGLIEDFPYVILILQYTFVISSLLSLYKLNHAYKRDRLSFNQSVKHEASSLPPVGDFLSFPPFYFHSFSWFPNTP